MGPHAGHRNSCPNTRELAEQALVFVRDQLSTQARTGRFTEPQSVDGTAPAIDRLAGFLGRSAPPQL
jgi:hypothetical protein